MADTVIQVPVDWEPRDYQRAFWQEMQDKKRGVAVWHRRAGKDSVGLNWTVSQAMKRVGIYWHMFPTQAQGRKAIWKGKTYAGRPYLSYWPEELVVKKREDEMTLDLANGSLWQVVGSDNYDSLVGTNPVGVVMSEYSIADPASWDFIRPILLENDGWAVFLYTPRGRNHGHALSEIAKHNDRWAYSLLTVDDTQAVSEDKIQQERDDGMSEEMIQQEYYCSFEAPLFGAYYAKEMLAAEKRIGHVAYDQAAQVETWWDLGYTDSTSIWFAQRIGQEIHLIDYYEASGEPLAHYVRVLQEKGYVYSDHVFPHDVQAKELIAGKSRYEVLTELGVDPMVVPNHKVDDRIEATRAMLAKCWFDREKCERGIEALRSYRHEYDEKHEIFKNRPVHDWASHGADAFGYGAMYAPADEYWEPLRYDNRGTV